MTGRRESGKCLAAAVPEHYRFTGTGLKAVISVHNAHDSLIRQAGLLATEVTVAKAELGMKLTCESCEARFYDLNKTPGVCPKCGASNTRPVIFKASRRTAEPAEPKKVEPAPKPKTDLDGIDDSDDDSDDEDVMEDTSDLGDDDVDVVVTKKDDD